jgi:hypothetical protein
MSARKVLISRLEKIYGKKSTSISLGYTDIFAQAFVSIFKIESEKSLIKNAKLQIQLSQIRYFFCSFIGQEGQMFRKIAISTLEDFPNTQIKKRKAFGGYIGEGSASMQNGIESIKILFQSKFSLCPPGNISGNSYRIVESIICGAVPLLVKVTPSDPTFLSENPFDSLKALFWRDLLNSAMTLEKNRIQELSHDNILKLAEYFEVTKSSITEMVFHKR